MAIEQVIFVFVFFGFTLLFIRNFRRILRNINLGKDINRSDNPKLRWKTMAKVALGQSKMKIRPVAAFFHLIIYLGFIVINIEVIEILIDGIFGTHRVLSFLGNFYSLLIGTFEIFAFLVLIACIVFFFRRNFMSIKRFLSDEMKGWPKSDANIILIVEILLMLAFLTMNACDNLLFSYEYSKYAEVSFSIPISEYLIPLFSDLSLSSILIIERFCWWFHIIGILAFLNYLVISKHLHIILAFPNTYFSNLNSKGEISNMSSVTNEVKMMLNPDIDPFSINGENSPERFGAKDVRDLTWVQLMNAYSCTECGRCSSECPANQTGKLLSPRKIMMDVRDRIEEVGKGIDNEGSEFKDNKSLLNDYITSEELWACTSCNACTEACPINIDPLSIIIDMRRYLVMEESAAPNELNNIFANIENNGAPWQFPAANRLNWKDEE